MPGLSERKIEIVRMLVESAPDPIVGGLSNALAAADGDTALAGVRKLVETEVADRRLRNVVLAPIAPLFVGDGRATDRLVFPGRALALIWKAVKDEAPDEVCFASRLLVDSRPLESPPEIHDILVSRVGAGLGDPDRADYDAIRAMLEAARPGATETLIACIAIAPIVRSATFKLPDWIARITDERSAAARVAYKDAVAVSDDAGPRFFDMLSAQMAEPWTILRIVSAVMDRPTERFLAASEFAVFALRLMDEIDKNLAHVAHFDLNGGPAAGRAAGATVELITQQIAEMENAVDLGREGGWGGRVQKQKQSLAAVVEGRLREIEKVLALALPSQQVRVARAMKSLPRLTQEPDLKAADRAATLLTFAEVIRNSANYGGFASSRAKTIEKICEILDHYVEESLALIREHLVEDFDLAQRFLKIAADCMSLVRDPRAGEIVRRRAVAAVATPKPAAPAEI